MLEATQEQARRFVLDKQGLLGQRRFRGEQGVMAYVRQAGCVQYDPIDICGRSHEQALLARVRGFSRGMLDGLLYEKRELIDFFDKNMCILPAEDWPCMDFVREGFRRGTRGGEKVEKAIPEVRRLLMQRGTLSAQELDMNERADWYWNGSTLGRAALETLYFRGELVVHHKTGTQKSYAPAQNCLPKQLLDAPYPFSNEAERQRWQVLRRIGAVGLLWNAPSDAWLGVAGLHARAREAAFAAMEEAGEIAPVRVEGVSRPLYVRAEDAGAIARPAAPAEKSARLLAPLDCLLWDRRLIGELFHFFYKWEIYTPEAQRRYGYYVLPVLWGDRFAGRVEPVRDRREGVLRVRAFWPEQDFRVSDRFLWGLEDELAGLAAFHGLKGLAWEQGWLRP